MSIVDSLRMPRLYWYRGRGVAQRAFDKPATELKSAPALAFMFLEIDYEPGVCYQIRPDDHSPMRDMLPDEIEACRRYLDAM